MTTAFHVRPVSSPEELLAITGQDPFIRFDLPSTTYAGAWSIGDAVAFTRRRQSGTEDGITVTGPHPDVEHLLEFVATEMDLTHVTTVSVDRAAEPLLAQAFRGRRHLIDGGDWDWLWTRTAPAPLPEERLLVLLDDSTDAPDILALNAIGNPSAESRPGEGVSERWVGVRDGGRLVAAAATQRTGGGIPHLTGITVAPSHRGRHLGRAMTAALTRHAVRTEGVCTLAMYADNQIARALYTGLGYQVAHAWASRRLVHERAVRG